MDSSSDHLPKLGTSLSNSSASIDLERRLALAFLFWIWFLRLLRETGNPCNGPQTSPFFSCPSHCRNSILLTLCLDAVLISVSQVLPQLFLSNLRIAMGIGSLQTDSDEMWQLMFCGFILNQTRPENVWIPYRKYRLGVTQG